MVLLGVHLSGHRSPLKPVRVHSWYHLYILRFYAQHAMHAESSFSGIVVWHVCTKTTLKSAAAPPSVVLLSVQRYPKQVQPKTVLALQ